jgi:hypothetical protein
VSLITRDGGFYLDKDPTKGLARNLASEPVVELGRLAVYPSIESFLEDALPDRVPQASDGIDNLIEERARKFYSEDWDPREMPVATLLQGKVRFRGFPNQKANLITIAFTARFIAQYDFQTELGYVEFKGECSFNRESRSIGDFQIHESTHSYTEDEDDNDEEVSGKRLSEAEKWLAQRDSSEQV